LFGRSRAAARETGLNHALPIVLAATASVLAGVPAEAAIVPPPAELAGVPVHLAVDLGSAQVLTEREADRRFLPASMTKVMTAWVAFEKIANGSLDPQRKLTVRPETAKAWAGRGTSMWLKPGEQVSVDDLLRGITTISANDACVVLAEGVAGSVAAWTELMNAEARRLGMTGTHFATPNGWPDQGKTFVTARDMVRLGEAMVERHPDLYRRYFGRPVLIWNGVEGRNHDPVTGVVPGADGIKTGHTAESGYSFLGTARRQGRRLMIVIGGATSEAQRARAARSLLEWGFAEWQSQPLYAPGAVVGSARVQGGDARRVELIAPRRLTVAMPRTGTASPELRIRYRGPLVAPFDAGAQLAELEVRVPGQPTAVLPLVVARSVGAAGPFDRLVNGLAGLVE
jgi:D-alanyl-D-alanine carboxypeptidase (penicillin-binding protein 5/6)